MQNERTNVIDLNLRLFIVRIAPKTFAKIMQCVSFKPSHIFDISEEYFRGKKLLTVYITDLHRSGMKNWVQKFEKKSNSSNFNPFQEKIPSV
jgi:hypothetical protein